MPLVEPSYDASLKAYQDRIKELEEALGKSNMLLARAKRIIEGSSSIPHLIEEDLEAAYWRNDDLLRK